MNGFGLPKGQQLKRTEIMRTPNLKSMSAEALIDLRADITRILDSKVSAERKDLQAKLDKLESFGGRGRGRRTVIHALKGRKVAPKYRGPDGETWTGRGLKPRWLTALVADGRKPEEFAVGGEPSGAKKPARKALKGRKTPRRKAKA